MSLTTWGPALDAELTYRQDRVRRTYAGPRRLSSVARRARAAVARSTATATATTASATATAATATSATTASATAGQPGPAPVLHLSPTPSRQDPVRGSEAWPAA
ncbi:hypothetical protein OEB99_11610 [Actinotalea sp. M2MS4P-6]|uniref:hypothetical protein n=1 Tax=Actinotalea sp. M2MS4P-6 TaxID=2983762 RepID=UPI0021E4DD9A|nr:hypothetical protein [Actinotalea sp. M2MS4P-6]MCV2394954.1 hypothetical protein [Actinotalea sp. M2MS4P-6]